MRVLSWFLVVSSLAGCPGGSSSDDDATETDQGPREFEDFINTTVSPVGDLSCYTPGDPWLTQDVDPGKVGVVSGTGDVVDFQSDNPVAEATVQVWFDNAPQGAPSSNAVSNLDGRVAMNLQTCAPQAYKVSTNPDLESTIDTYQKHQILDATSATAAEFLSVSVTTYRLIPSILGLSVRPGHAVIAGRAYDCNRDPIRGAQIIVRDRETGAIQQDQMVRYFIDEFPNRDQPETSADGLWNAIDVATGSYSVEMWVYDGSGHILVGATELDIVPDSINIANTFVGYGDGVRYPDSCLVVEE
jgi:hypothetical protein